MVTKIKLIWRLIRSDHYAVTTSRDLRVLWNSNAITDLNLAVVMAEALSKQHEVMMDHILKTATDQGRLHDIPGIIAEIERIK